MMENYDKDDELKKCCKQTLSLMSFSLVLTKDIPVFLEAFDKVRDLHLRNSPASPLAHHSRIMVRFLPSRSAVVIVGAPNEPD